MRWKWKTIFKSIFLLTCAVPVYALSYAALLFYWGFPVAPGSEFLSLYLPTSIFMLILVVINHLALKWVMGDISLVPGASASVFFLMLAFYAIWLGLLPGRNDYRQCDFYTKQMKGGVHRFGEELYRIEVCGLNGIIQPENFPDDELRLRVLSMKGELLAERFFNPLLAMGEPVAPLRYGDDFLAYSMRNQGLERRLRMPPSGLDWLRSRLPRLWP